MKIAGILRKTRKFFSQYEPSIEILVSKNALIHNFNEYKKKYPKLSFSPVLKSNAYGHGLIEVARIFDKEKAPFFTVDSLFEARTLRSEGIQSKILIIGYTNPKNVERSKISDTSFTITGLDQLKEISKVIKNKKTFHLKIDTGMNRQGILLNQVDEAIEIINGNKYIILEGICSHFADADDANETFTKLQIDRWNEIADIFKNNFESVKYYHVSATAGTYYTDNVYANVARLGIGLYGINTSLSKNLDLKPSLEMRSVVGSVKIIPEGEYVGYNITYRTKNITKIATVPVGYFEGIDRRLSNCGYFKIDGFVCPIVGRVSMNITSVDVTSVPDVKLGDKIVVISSNRNDINSVEKIAKFANSIPYEIFVHIPQHLRRVVVE